MALLHKFKSIFTCKHRYKNHCKSSLGNIYFDKISESFFPNKRYDSLQKTVVENFKTPPTQSKYNKFTPIQLNTKCVSKYKDKNQYNEHIKKFTSWNVQELWWYCYKGNKINNIINYISNSDSDVICLQEVFEPRSMWLIVNDYNVFKKYPYFLSGDMHNRFLIGENSGLLVLSKKPIIFHQFTPFMKSSCPDFYAAKGALYFSIDNYNFITTHLQSSNCSLACAQLKFILNKSPFNSKVILLGDLNTSDPFTTMGVDTNLQKHTHDSGCLLDHIIPVYNDIVMNVDVDYINLENLSDHYPVNGEIL